MACETAADDDLPGTPEPDTFLHAAWLLGVEPSACAVRAPSRLTPRGIRSGRSIVVAAAPGAAVLGELVDSLVSLLS